MTKQIVLSGAGGGGFAPVSGRVSLHRTLSPGDVLVTRMTDPSLLSDMLMASAIVTDEGGALCHAAIICRERGIPFVVGTREATAVFTEGMTVTVDPVGGTVTANG